MRPIVKKLLLAWLLVFVLAPAAFAGLGAIGPFSFTFANTFLNNAFLFPFFLGGC